MFSRRATQVGLKGMPSHPHPSSPSPPHSPLPTKSESVKKQNRESKRATMSPKKKKRYNTTSSPLLHPFPGSSLRILLQKVRDVLICRTPPFTPHPTPSLPRNMRLGHERRQEPPLPRPRGRRRCRRRRSSKKGETTWGVGGWRGLRGERGGGGGGGHFGRGGAKVLW